MEPFPIVLRRFRHDEGGGVTIDLTSAALLTFFWGLAMIFAVHVTEPADLAVEVTIPVVSSGVIDPGPDLALNETK